MSALRLRFYREQVTELRSGFLGEVGVPVGLGDWRWSLTASNGRRVGASSEAYRKRIDAVKNAALVLGVHPNDMRDEVSEVAAGGVGLWWDRPDGTPFQVEVQP